MVVERSGTEGEEGEEGGVGGEEGGSIKCSLTFQTTSLKHL